MADFSLNITPEEAINLAKKLLDSAELVMDRRKRLSGAYDYQNVVGTNLMGDETAVLRIRIGNLD
jgi:hypothetical protein